MGNVDTYRAAHEAFNRRQYDEMVRAMREDVVYTDHPRHETMKGTNDFVDWAKNWTGAFSDAKVGDPHYIDGGDYVVALFHGTGTNDGPLGPMPSTGRRMDMPFCEVMHFDSGGRIVSGEIFYDQVTMMVQLGHMEPPPAG